MTSRSSRAPRLLAVLTSGLVVASVVGPVAPALAVAPALHQTNYVEDRYFSPNGDGLEDVYAQAITYTEPATVDLRITSGAGNLVVARSGVTDADEENTFPFSWDGLTEGGAAAPEGVYTVTLAAVGKIGGGSLETRVRVGVSRKAAPAVAFTSPAAAATLRAGDKVRVSATGFERQPAVTYLEQAGTGRGLGSSYGYDGDGSDNSTLTEVTPGDVADGPLDLVARVVYYDALFGEHQVVTAARSYSYVSAPTLSTATAPRYYFPNFEPYGPYYGGEKAAIDLRLGRRARLTTDVVDATGHVVRVLRNAADTAAGDLVEGFALRSGEQDSAPLLPNGRYTFRAHAQFDGGQVADVTLPIGVDDRSPRLALTAPPAGTLTGPTPATVTVDADLLVESASLSAPGPDDSYFLGSSDYETPPAASVTFTLQTRLLPDGEHAVTAYGTVLDALGGRRYLTAPAVRYTVDAALTVTGDDDAVALVLSGDPDTSSVATRYVLSRDAVVTTTVTDGAGALVATLETGQPVDREAKRTVTWDGTLDGGADAPEGTYVLTVQASAGGRSATLTRTITLTRTTAGTLLADKSGRVSGPVRLTFVPAEGVSPSYGVAVYDQGTGRYLAYLPQEYDEAGEPTGVFAGVLDSSAYSNGEHLLYAQDDSGLQTPRLALTFANAVHLGPLAEPTTFHPQDPTDARWPRYSGAFSTDQAATVTLTITSATGTTVRQLSSTRESEGFFDLRWDGRDADGAYVPDGTYDVAVRAEEPFVPSTDEASTQVVVASRDLGTLTAPNGTVDVGASLRLDFTPRPGLGEISWVSLESVEGSSSTTASSRRTAPGPRTSTPASSRTASTTSTRPCPGTTAPTTGSPGRGWSR